MKFDFIIGNPPYQDESTGEQKTFLPPIYDKFMDAAYSVADKVELITPARFLFKAGSTPKDWNTKMLADTHFKVLDYEVISGNIFPSTDIKGGVCISYRDNEKSYEAIEVFTAYPELNSILSKVIHRKDFSSLSQIMLSRTAYRFTELLHKENPKAKEMLSKGHAYDISSNAFKRLPQIFFDKKPNDNKEYIRIWGLVGTERVLKFIRKNYVVEVSNLNHWKVLVPSANGSGALGEVVSTPLIGEPLIGSTETFMGIGAFDTRKEAEAAQKYVKTKFARAMLGILKVTQHNSISTWKYVPIQDFTSSSDIDWSKSVQEIDLQLYDKYGLTAEERNFIEEKVKKME